MDCLALPQLQDVQWTTDHVLVVRPIDGTLDGIFKPQNFDVSIFGPCNLGSKVGVGDFGAFGFIAKEFDYAIVLIRTKNGDIIAGGRARSIVPQ